jgi:hypothetical protein
MDIVEGKSGLWDGIGEDKKECIRGEFPSGGGDTYRRADEQPSWFTSRHSRYVALISDSHIVISAWETVSSLAHATCSDPYPPPSSSSNP